MTMRHSTIVTFLVMDHPLTLWAGSNKFHMCISVTTHAISMRSFPIDNTCVVLCFTIIDHTPKGDYLVRKNRKIKWKLFSQFRPFLTYVYKGFIINKLL